MNNGKWGSRMIKRFFSGIIVLVCIACGGGGGGSDTAASTGQSNSAKAITAFGFAALSVSGSINEAAHTVSVTVPEGTTVTSLSPTVVHTGATISPASGVARNFTNPVTYTVTAENGSTQNYIVTVTIMSSTQAAWRLMTVRSKGEFDRGELGGRAEQYLQGAARCRSNPDYIYLSHDCGQTWRSTDGAMTWRKPLNIGLYLPMGQSIEVDPVNCNRVIMVADNSYDYRHPAYTGIYLSEDGGDHWEFVQAGRTLHSRRYEHDVAWAPSSVDGSGAKRWYVALYNESTESNNTAAGIYVSNDYGRTWTKGASLIGHNPVYEIQVSPTDQQTLYVASSGGLYRSTDGGQSLSLMTSLPAGSVTSVAVHPGNAGILYAASGAATGHGLYRSDNSGTDFAQVMVSASQTVLNDARRIFMHPVNGSIFYVIPGSSGTAIRTENAGASFQTTSISLPSDISERRWGLYFRGAFPFILMSATDDHSVVAQSTGAALYRSTDGLVFVNGSTLFDGANCGLTNYSIAFDPSNANRFALGNQDIGMYYTDTGADWFYARATPWSWVSDGTVAWSNQQSLDFCSNSSRVISSIGNVYNKKLAYSPDNGLTWQIVDSTVFYYWRVACHPSDPLVVFAGNKRSQDGGLTFSGLPFPAESTDSNMQMMDYCRAQPDTVYAVSRSSNRILRSDDRGSTWRLYATSPGSVGPFDPIMTFAADPVNPDVVYALDQTGDLARYDGTSWRSLGVLQNVTRPSGFFVYVRSVMVDPRHPEIIYAGIFGSGVSSIFRSIDSGTTWVDISYNRFRDGVSSINVSPISGEVMVGGCSGTWVLPPPYQSTGGIYNKLVP